MWIENTSRFLAYNYIFSCISQSYLLITIASHAPVKNIVMILMYVTLIQVRRMKIILQDNRYGTQVKYTSYVNFERHFVRSGDDQTDDTADDQAGGVLEKTLGVASCFQDIFTNIDENECLKGVIDAMTLQNLIW